jgi:S1-C subfamily serine protease
MKKKKKKKISILMAVAVLGGSVGVFGCGTNTSTSDSGKYSNLAIHIGKDIVIPYSPLWNSEEAKLKELREKAVSVAQIKCGGLPYEISGVISEGSEFRRKDEDGNTLWQLPYVAADIICEGSENERIADKSPPPKVKRQPDSSPPETGSTGSGFFVTKLGHILTNQHVVANCRTITVGDSANSQVTADVLDTDQRNDLALLRISSTKMASAETKSLISKLAIKIVPLATDGLIRSSDAKLGEDVLVAGYPYGDIFSNTIKVTKGIVSATRGLGDDTGQFQIDAAVQPGNSGGPIYDESGNIVGVVVAQLNKLKMAEAIGSLPENVNFGIKASTVKQFLNSSGLPTKWSERSEPMPTMELAKIAKSQTLMVVCHR